MPISQDMLFQAEISADQGRKLLIMARGDQRSKASFFRWLIEEEWKRRQEITSTTQPPTPPTTQQQEIV